MTKKIYATKVTFKDGSFEGVFFDNKKDRDASIEGIGGFGSTLADEFHAIYGSDEDLLSEVNFVEDSDNFETALTALIEHHGADALTALAAVMRHYEIGFHGDCECIQISTVDKLIAECNKKGPCCGTFTITANDIKPEK